jgi:hypothetical protein
MDKHATYFAEAREICEEFGIIKLMNFCHHYNEDIIAQFFATVYIGTDDAKTMTWMTDGKQLSSTWAQFAHCLDYPVLPRNTEGVFRAYYTKKPIDKALLDDLYIHGDIVLGSAKYLIPIYDILLGIYHEVLNPKVGCKDQIFGFLMNLLYLTYHNRGTGQQLDVMDYIWEGLWTCIISRKAPVYAPYIMRFIASRWEAMELGNLMEICHCTMHKPKDLRVKVHPMPWCSYCC